MRLMLLAYSRKAMRRVSRALQAMLENGLVCLEPKGRKRFKTSITERGREFLAHYRACNKLFPVDG